MHKIPSYLRSKERVSIITFSIFLTGFVVFLLVSHYQSLQKLRDSSLKQYRYEVETRSRGLAHFLNAHRQSIDHLADTSKLRLYFENKALGMSLQYGLRSTMIALGRELNAFIALQKIGEQRLFHRVVFLTSNGDIIADSGKGQSPGSKGATHRRLFLGLKDGFYVIHTTGQDSPGFVYTRAFPFKDEYAGQIVAWLNTNVIKQLFLVSGEAANFTKLVHTPDRLISNDTGPVKPNSVFLESGLLDKILAEYKKHDTVLHFRIPVTDTGFDLVEIVSARKVIGSTSPRTLLLALVLLFLGLAGIAVVLVRMMAQNIVLQTRVEESRKRESAIELKHIQLQKEIEERERSEAARDRLEVQLQRVQKMEAIGLLAGGVAHDLNNILSGLVSYPELLLMEMPEDSPTRGAIETIQKSGQKAATIVQDLLTLARRGVAMTEVLNFNQIVAEYLASPEHGRLLEFHKKVQVETELALGLLNIQGSPVHLSKTLMNLISNAAESMPQGGRIKVSTENRYVDRPIRGYDKVEEGDYVILQISDEGIGISPEDQEHIFEPFYTKKVMGRSGTGLGMSVVWNTVKDHQGYIDLKSVEDQGTRITLYFPVTTNSRQLADKVTGVDDLMGAGQSILVVDDVEEQRQIAQKILEKLDYKVTLSPSGEHAVEHLRHNKVDLVVLDMIMDPGIDGLETYRKLANLHPGQKAVIASGYSETKRVREAQRLGAGTYVKKPYSIMELGKAVWETL